MATHDTTANVLACSSSATRTCLFARTKRRPSAPEASGVFCCAHEEEDRTSRTARRVVEDDFLPPTQKIIVYKERRAVETSPRRERTGNATATPQDSSRTRSGVVTPGNDMVVDPCTAAASWSKCQIHENGRSIKALSGSAPAAHALNLSYSAVARQL